MDRNQIESAIHELNHMVLSGRAMEAFEKFYHERVTMQENQLPPTVSKEANRQREEAFFESIIEFRGAEVKGLAVGDNISYVTWQYDYTHREWGVRNYTQVSVQHWQDGQIIFEQFFYNN